MMSPRGAVGPLKSGVTPLLAWFASVKRDLPWRKNRTAYRVWISELMLQQTRVDTVIPYYQRFMKRFPSVKSLALADRDEVLKYWEGLGYYARARNMHKAAEQVHEEFQGRFPRCATDLQKLPGIGPYSAAAIASMAFGESTAVLDGNVIRVLARLTTDGRDAGSSGLRHDLLELANDLIPEDQPGAFNEAMMELGALVCTPRNPKCDSCPLQGFCRAYAKDVVAEYPYKPKKAKVPHKVVGAAVVVNRKGEFLIAKRPDHKMLGGLWEFPGGVLESGESMEECIERELMEEMGIVIQCDSHLCTVKHAYSHFTIELHAHLARMVQGPPTCIECADFAWESVEGIGQYALSRADQHILTALQGLHMDDR